jgi:dTDP-4-amino-4,6-dideoxygalactose transaminase
MQSSYTEQLAIFGGRPVRQKKWPQWPQVKPTTADLLSDVLYSGRWAISGAYTGKQCYERKFSAGFAAYTGAKFCVPTTSGTAALTLALLALGIGPGDEVLVPGLTWVACASAVMSIGAIPILVDIDPTTLCMSFAKAKYMITDKCKAIMLVHLYGSISELEEFLELSQTLAIPIIEDCSQAHGARWRGKHVGTFGKIGCFSMQQSKLLTSGEGGAVITNDPKLNELMEQLRCDGRMFAAQKKISHLELVECGDIQGQNMCLSEFQAAILLDNLSLLEAQNSTRVARAKTLNGLLSEIGVAPLVLDQNVTSPTYYNYTMKVNLSDFAHNSIDSICRALSAELNAAVNPIYRPLNNHPLYCPLKSPRIKSADDFSAYDPSRFALPNAWQARQEYITFHHSLLLDDEAAMYDIAAAIKKLKWHAKTLLDTPQEVSNMGF